MEPVEAVLPATLAARARRAYELGRLELAGRRAWPVPLGVALVVLCCGARGATFLGGAALLVVTLALLWRGQALGRGASAGLAAGLPPLVLPLLVQQGGHLCAWSSCCSLGLAACVAGGLTAGAFLGAKAARVPSGRARFLLAGALVGGLMGGLGCGLAGVAGIAGMTLGLVGGGGPVLLVSSLQRG